MAENFTTANSKLVEKDQTALFEMQDTTSAGDGISDVLDSYWARHSFLLSDEVLAEPTDVSNRYWSSASAKFTDTRLGSNIGINSRPQFTRYSDIRVPGRLSGRNEVSLSNTSGNYGMGRYYSEAIDDPSQTIYLRFGVPQFNSLTNFLTRAFDPNQISIARTGKGPSAFYMLGKLAGTAATVIAAPAIAATVVAAKFLGSFFTRPTSKFYTLKPTMHVYWSTVNVLANTLAINRGIFPKIIGDEAPEKVGNPFKLDEEYLNALSNMLPDVFRGGKFFDIYAMANRAQRLQNNLVANDYDNLNKGTSTNFTGYLKKEMSGNGSHPTYISNDKGEPTLAARMDQLFNLSKWFVDDTKPDENARLELNPKIGPDGKEIKDSSFFSDYIKSFDAEMREGSEWAVFKVDHTGPVQEAFGNAVVESDISQKLNSISSQVREARFSFADGNISGDAITQMATGAIGAVKDLMVGALDGVSLGGLAVGLGGSGFIDIPKHWQSSTANLPKSTYTMDLISPYGNPISQMQNIYIPLCMLLAGALPLSTGKSSYTSPFICELFDRGRCQVRLGMIESLSISRGTSNLAFNLKGNALALQVTFSIVDLSSIMHMPVSTGKLGAAATAGAIAGGVAGGAAGGIPGAVAGGVAGEVAGSAIGGAFDADMTIDEDNILCDYLAVLAGQDMYTQMYPMAKAKMIAAKRLMSYNTLTSPAYWAAITHEEATSGILKYVTFGAFNGIEAATRGSAIVTQ